PRPRPGGRSVRRGPGGPGGGGPVRRRGGGGRRRRLPRPAPARGAPPPGECVDPFPAEDLFDRVGNVLILAAGDVGSMLGNRDLAPEASVRVRQLEADVAARRARSGAPASGPARGPRYA